MDNRQIRMAMEKNTTRKNILINSLTAMIGLFFFGFGVYLIVQANIGVAPWDVLNLGFVNTFGIKFGNANVLISFIILGIIFLLKEQIGLGMILDSIIVGKTIDLLNWINPIPKQENIFISFLLVFLGMFIMGFSQWLYMKSSLGCGTRDALLVGLKRRVPKVPIGVVSICLLSVVTLIGWLLGGQVGFGTLICAFLMGPIMQFDFKLVKFEPTSIKHQNIVESGKIIFAKKKL